MHENFIQIVIYSAIPILFTAIIIVIFGCYKVRKRKVKKNVKELKHRKRKYKRNSFKRLTNQDTNCISVEVSPKRMANFSTIISLNESSSNEDISDEENFSNLHVVPSKRSLSFVKFVKEKEIQYGDSNNCPHTKSCIRNRCIENFSQTEALEKEASVQVEIIPKAFYKPPLRNIFDPPQIEECPHYGQVCKMEKSFVCNRRQTSPQTFQVNCVRELEEKDFRISRWLRECEQFSTTESQHGITDDCIINVSPLRCRSFEEWPLTRTNGNCTVTRINDYSNEFYKGDDVGKFKYVYRVDQNFPRKIGREQVMESGDYQDYRFAETRNDLYSGIHEHTWQKESRVMDLHLEKLDDRWLKGSDERLAELESNLKNSHKRRHEEKRWKECGNRDLSRRKIDEKWKKETKERDLHRGKLDSDWPKEIKERYMHREKPEDKYQKEYHERGFYQEKFDDYWQNETGDRDLHQRKFYRKGPKEIRGRSLYRGKIEDKLQKESCESDLHKEKFPDKWQKETRKRDLCHEIKKTRESDLCPKKVEKKWYEESSERDLYTEQFEDECQVESSESDLYGEKFSDEWQKESSKRESFRGKLRDKWPNKITERNLYRMNPEDKMCIESRMRESPYKTTDSETSRLSQESKNYRVSEFKKDMTRGMCEYKRQNERGKTENSSRGTDHRSIMESSEGKSYSIPESRKELHHGGKYENGRQDRSKDKCISKKANSKQFMEVKECKKCKISEIRQNVHTERYENQAKNVQMKYKSPSKNCDEFAKLGNKNISQHLDLRRKDNLTVNHEEKSSNSIHRNKIALCELEYDQFVKEVNGKDHRSSRLNKDLCKNRLDEISEDSYTEVGSSEVSDHGQFMEAIDNKKNNVSQLKKGRHVEESMNGNWKSHCPPLNVRHGELSEVVKAKNLVVSKMKKDRRFPKDDDLDAKENFNIAQKLIQNHMSPIKERNHITKLKPVPDRKILTNYLKGQYHNLDDEIPQKTQRMVQELKKVLEKRGVAK